MGKREAFGSPLRPLPRRLAVERYGCSKRSSSSRISAIPCLRCAQPLGSFLSDLGRSLRVGDIVPQLQHEVLELNDQEIVLRCMPHQRGVPLLFRDDDGYSHGLRVPENGLRNPAV